jgi:hypothetical protein
VPSFHRILRLAPLALLLALPAFAADPITGIVTNKTNGKPSAGDDVVLIRLQQAMQDSTHTKTDARGHFTLVVPDDDKIHLVRVTHQKATYFQPVQPGTTTVNIDVYDAAPKIDGVSLGVQELHIEGTDTELHIVEILQVLNESSPKRTQFGPAGYDFYIPADARILRTGAVTDGGMPVQTAAVPVGDPGHYTFLFPIRPGETQFAVLYSVPYTKSLKLTPRLATPVKTLAIVLPKSMKLTPGPSSPYAPSPAAGDRQTFTAQDVSPSQPLDFTVSGIGTLPQQQQADAAGAPGAPSGQTPADANASAGVDASGNPDTTKFGGGMGKPLDPDADHDPWSKYKWWILGGLALLMAVAAGVLLRRPAPVAVVLPAPIAPAANHQTGLQQALKEELFALETDRLQKKISDEEYTAHKAAIDVVLLRSLSRGKDSDSQ